MTGGWVYILANRYRGTTYIGVTAHLRERVAQHRAGTSNGFAADYGCNLLVYAEPYDRIEAAIYREKQLKKWNREWKFRLIEEQNPDWEDRFDDLVVV